MPSDAADAIPSAVVLGPGTELPWWSEGLGEGARVRAAGADTPDGPLEALLREADVVLVDGEMEAPLSLGRKLHRLAPSLQLVVVSPEDRLGALRRSALFTPGLGEPWLMAPSDVTPGLLRRAAEVAGQRRGHARRMERVAAEVDALPPPGALSPVLSDQYLATLLELLPGPVLALDEHDRIVFANPAALGALGLDRIGPGPGPGLTDVVGADRPDLLSELLDDSRESVVHRQLELRPGSGEGGTYEVVLAPVPGERPLRALLLHDVSERVQAFDRMEEQAMQLEVQAEEMQVQSEEMQVQAEDLRIQAQERERLLSERDRALVDLRELIRQRSRFYASMSHELRTPINAIIGYNDLLLGEVFGPLPDDHREPLERGSRAARHLLELVNDILDLSKVEAGKLALEAAVVEVPELVADLTATMDILARANDVDLRFEIDASCDRPLRTDPRRLRQVLTNLLSNAIRYGPGAPVDVRCRSKDGALEVDVEDRGPGIPPERLGAIFDEFVQLENGETGGTGLGLSIARALTEALGGELSVVSEVGRGSTFTIRVPPLDVG